MATAVLSPIAITYVDLVDGDTEESVRDRLAVECSIDKDRIEVAFVEGRARCTIRCDAAPVVEVVSVPMPNAAWDAIRQAARTERVDGGVSTGTVYIVEGACGDYEDRTHWMVRALGTEQEAVDLADRLNAWWAAQDESVWECGNGEPPDDDPGLQYVSGDWELEYTVIPVPFGPRA